MISSPGIRRLSPHYARITDSDREYGRPSGCARRGSAGGRDRLRRKAHPEPLPSLDDSSDLQAFHYNPAQRPDLALHYQCRDYAPLQSRHPCLCSLIAAGPSRARRGEAAPTTFLLREPTAQGVGQPPPRSHYGVSCIMRARCPDTPFGYGDSPGALRLRPPSPLAHAPGRNPDHSC
jgi:hypothetical protein